MGFFSQLLGAGVQTLLKTDSISINQVRGKAKKLAAAAKNAPRKKNPKHRGLKMQDGHYVAKNTILVLQFNKLNFHPGLNVGFGKNGTLFAMEPGRVVITCETPNLNWEHTWIQRLYAGYEGHTMFRKYLNVIPFEQHKRFKLIDQL